MIQIGCSGFGIAQSLYMEKFQILEVQHTFYQPPKLSTLQKWRTNAPSNFEFVVKAWQLITHESSSPTYRRLKEKLTSEQLKQCGAFRLSEPNKAAWNQTLLCAQALGSSRILLQSPPSFSPDPEHIENIERFLSWIGHIDGLKLYWEPRGAWDPAVVSRLCKQYKMSHAVDPFLSGTVTPDDKYFRLHGGPGFRHVYSDAELETLRGKINLEQSKTCVFFNNLTMINDATRFGELLKHHPC